MSATVPQETKILRIAAVAERAGVCRATIYNWTESAGFPRQIRLGPRSVGWVAHEVDAWLAERIADRDATVA